MSELPKGWSSATLGEVIERLGDFRGRTPKKLGMDWGGGGIPALSAINVRMGSIDISRTEHFGSRALFDRWMGDLVTEKGDIIVTTEAPLGMVAELPDDAAYILSQRVILLRPHQNVLLPPFVSRQMRSPSFQAALQANDSGSTVRGIRQSRLVQLPLNIPPLNEQRRIVEKLAPSVSVVVGSPAKAGSLKNPWGRATR